MTIPAKYDDGVFKPFGVVKIMEGTLVEVYVPHEEKDKPRSIRDLGFADMWAYRDDITDGLSLREPSPRQPPRVGAAREHRRPFGDVPQRVVL